MGTAEQHRKGYGLRCGDLDNGVLLHSACLTILFLATTLFLTSCGGSAASSAETRSSVSISIAPSSVNLAPGGTQTFAATVTGSSNPAVTWSVQEAAGGSITPAGVYTAPNTPGTYHVIATSQADNTKSATATVMVPSFSITITPTEVGLRPGATQTFSATVTGSSNTAVMWSVQEGSIGGTITETGTYTAPTTLGTYHVIVTSVADPTKSATATVIVSETGSFLPTGRLSTRRDYATATLLSDGRVLVAGGDTLGRPDGLPTNSAELFDPAGGTFSSIANMTTPREGQTATLLADGTVLLTGGRVTQFLFDTFTETAEIYDPISRSFSRTTGSMSVERFEHTATLLENGKVLIVGGSNNVSARGSAELYDPASRTFTPATSMLVPRGGHTATRLRNGKVLITGGGTEAAELYDPDTGSFTITGSMGSARTSHSATLLPNGKVLVTGGWTNTAEVYDPDSGSFSATSPMAWPRADHTATLLANGKVLVAGGYSSPSLPYPHVTATAELYDPTTGSFAAIGVMTLPRVGATATLLLSGQVLIAGGDGGGTAEIYE